MSTGYQELHVCDDTEPVEPLLVSMDNSVVSLFRRLRDSIQSLWEVKDPDAEFRKQNEAADKNEMYQLLYLGGGGKLVKDYAERRMSDEQFQSYLKENVEKFLYYGGQGKVITRREFARYKHVALDGKEANTPDDQIMAEFESYQHTAINQFDEHTCCFDLNKRGAIGETILHLCYINNTPMHREIAIHLLELYPKMALDIYEGSDFYGESALHIAIVNDDLNSVRLLVGRYRALLDARATGRFFRPHDLKEKTSIKLGQSNYEGEAYLGEYPLAFTASLGRMAMYDYLIEQSLRRRPGEGRCHPDKQDTFGNTVVHMAIIHNQKLMFYHAIHHNKMPASYTIPNEAGLTPLQLSFRLGREELFNALLELSSETQWTYGRLAYVAYPLSRLDSVEPDGRVNKQSALRVIVENDSIHHLKMLEGAVVHELLSQKWTRYCKTQFMIKLFWALLHLLALTVAVLTRPGDRLLGRDDTITKVRYVAEGFVILSCVAKIVTESLEIISRGSFLDYLKSLADFPMKAMYLIAVCLLFVCIPLRFLGMEWQESILMMFIVPMSWFHLVFFFRGNPSLGPLVVVFFKMLHGDLLRFSLIYFILLAVFTQAFFFMYKDFPAPTEAFTTVQESFMSSFIMTVGEFDWHTLWQSKMPWLSISMFVIFMWFISVLMLNMVIAMMARTYEAIKDRSRMEWKRQWAMIVLNVERSISRSRLAKYRQEYSMELKIKRRIDNRPEEEPIGHSNGGSRPSIRRKDTIKNVKVHKFKRGTRMIPLDRVHEMETITVRALLLAKLLPQSRAKSRREVKRKWKNAIKKVIVHQRFKNPTRAVLPKINRDIGSISRKIPLPPIIEPEYHHI